MRAVKLSCGGAYALYLMFLPVLRSQNSDLTCISCEITVKELDKRLKLESRKGYHSIGTGAVKTLRMICQEDTFQDYNYDIKKLSKSCQELVESNYAEILEALVEHYESDQPSSYLQLIKQVCYGLIPVCSLENHLNNESKIIFNQTSQEFEMEYGANAKFPNPVHEDL